MVCSMCYLRPYKFESFNFQYLGMSYVLICFINRYMIFIYIYIVIWYIRNIQPIQYRYLKLYCSIEKVVRYPVRDLKPWELFIISCIHHFHGCLSSTSFHLRMIHYHIFGVFGTFEVVFASFWFKPYGKLLWSL